MAILGRLEKHKGVVAINGSEEGIETPSEEPEAFLCNTLTAFLKVLKGLALLFHVQAELLHEHGQLGPPNRSKV